MISRRIVIILFVFLCYSCGLKNRLGVLTEGEIDYNLEYSEKDKDNPVIGIMPTSMTLKFNEHHMVQKVEGWLGLFSLMGISDFDNEKNFAVLKVLEKKYLYEKKPTDGPFGFRDFPNMRINYLDGTKMIAGYNCKKALIITSDPKIDSIYVFYTNKIKIKDPNQSNPFSKIDGVLLEFQMVMFNIQTKIIATSVSPAKIPDSEFKVPDGCQNVSKVEIEKVIQDFM